MIEVKAHIPMTTTRRAAVAAVIAAAGHPVTTVKLSCSPRAAWVYPDKPQTRALSDAYDAGQPVPVPQARIWDAYRRLISEARQLQAGRIGGGV